MKSPCGESKEERQTFKGIDDHDVKITSDLEQCFKVDVERSQMLERQKEQKKGQGWISAHHKGNYDVHMFSQHSE